MYPVCDDAEHDKDRSYSTHAINLESWRAKITLCRTTFTSKIVSNGEASDVTMVLDEGSVKELAASPPPGRERVPVTEANRQGIVDPLTAMLFSAAAASESLPQEACQHTLPIFDGHQRYDLKLAFKRMDKVRAEKGYAGPVVVCSAGYEPIAGHRASTPLVKYLSEGREMEITLAPAVICSARARARYGVLVVGEEMKGLVNCNFLPGSARRLELGTVSAEPLSRAYRSQK